MAIFIKSFNMEEEIFKLRNRYNDNLFKYGLIGEERVAYQLKICDEDVLCLYDVRLEVNGRKAQFDFLVLSRKTIYILEVKNLLGNIVVCKNGNIKRLIYKYGIIEECGMFNPFVQMNQQKENLKLFLNEHMIDKRVQPILIMANDKTLIKGNESMYNVIKYDKLSEYLKNGVNGEKLTMYDYEIGELLSKCTKKYNYLLSDVILRKMMNQYVPHFASKIDENYYIELITLRKTLSKKYVIPACNLFNNKEAEALVINKPTNKEEFVNIRGFKEKRFELYGEEVIKIFKKQ